MHLRLVCHVSQVGCVVDWLGVLFDMCVYIVVHWVCHRLGVSQVGCVVSWVCHKLSVVLWVCRMLSVS